MARKRTVKMPDLPPLRKLNAREKEKGWAEHTCPDHGAMVAGPVSLTVVCRCKKKALPMRDGKVMHRQTRKRLKASQ